MLVCLMLAACTAIQPDFQAPSVRLVSFEPVDSGGMAPRFQIGLHVVNPNAQDLNLRGVAYEVYLNRHRVVDGASHELPVVPAYGEADIEVLATVSLLDALQFVNSLLRESDRPVDYRLTLKLDVGALMPPIRIEDSGRLLDR